MRCVVAVAFWVVFAASATGQTRWSRWNGPGPGKRTGTAAVYEAHQQRVLLFGGTDLPILFNDTLSWNGAGWTLLPQAISPNVRQGHAMAYDAGRARTVLFGGFVYNVNSGNYVLGDTWEFDGTSWAQLHPAVSPSPRHLASMAYDVARRRVVLYGGTTGSAGPPLDDTWEWDGTQWIQRQPLTKPPPRWAAAAAWDGNLQQIVLFGGFPGFGDFWAWTGSNWSSLPAGPPGRAGHGMAWDSARNLVVLHGGYGLVGSRVTTLPDTWEWNGSSWAQRSASYPTSAAFAAFAYDAERGQVVRFGGEHESFGVVNIGETWLYGPTKPASFSRYGMGCVGSGGTPVVNAGGLPWLVDTVVVELAGARPSSSVALVLGASNLVWQGIPLPLDLTTVGAPGCWILTAVGISVPLTASGSGAASIAITIPNVPALCGAHFYAQFLVVDPGQNALNLVTSDAGDFLIGAK